nr:hypothetical protein [Nocardioides daedukensis]
MLEAADELYALTLAEFTPARDAMAKQLRTQDRPLADRIKTLRKPSTAAWVVNVLARREHEQVSQVLEVGAALREAQASLDGDELRALTRQRRQLTAALTQQARALASEEGLRVTSAVAEQVEATLTAAMVDESVGEAVRSGLLISALASTGVDDIEVGDHVAVPDAFGFTPTRREPAPSRPPELHVVPDPDEVEKKVAAAREDLAAADEELEAAGEAVDSAKGEVSDLEARTLQLQAEIDELRRRLGELETEQDEVDDALADARVVVEDAQAELSAARADRERADAALQRLLGS